MTRTPKKRKSKLNQIDACEALVRICGGQVFPPFDRDVIAGIVGERVVGNLAEVAKAFGAAANTPRKEWRSAGMPGEAKSWNLVDITIWQLERDAREASRQKSLREPGNERIKEIDLRLAELQLAKKEREELEASGRTVDVFRAQAEVRVVLALARDQLMSMSRTLYPLLPQSYCEEISTLIKAEARKVLVYIAEGSLRVLKKNTSEHYANILRQVDEIERNDARDGSPPVD